VAKAVRLASRTSYGMEISQDNGLILINMNLKSIKKEMENYRDLYERISQVICLSATIIIK
jgi:hypothetical protein